MFEDAWMRLKRLHFKHWLHFKQGFILNISLTCLKWSPGVTKKCTLPLHTLIFVCSTFRYTFYTLHTFYTFTHFSQIYTRARSRDHVEAQFTHLHAQFTHIYTFTHFTRPMDQNFFRIWFSSSDWGQKII